MDRNAADQMSCYKVLSNWFFRQYFRSVLLIRPSYDSFFCLLQENLKAGAVLKCNAGQKMKKDEKTMVWQAVENSYQVARHGEKSFLHF